MLSKKSQRQQNKPKDQNNIKNKQKRKGKKEKEKRTGSRFLTQTFFSGCIAQNAGILVQSIPFSAVVYSLSWVRELVMDVPVASSQEDRRFIQPSTPAFMLVGFICMLNQVYTTVITLLRQGSRRHLEINFELVMPVLNNMLH